MTRAGTGVTGEAWRREVEDALAVLPGLLGELDALSLRQKGLIEADDAVALSALVDARAGVLDALTECIAGLERRRAEWSLGASDRARVQAAIERVAAVANGVAARDRDDAARMRARRDDMARSLAGLGTARQAAGAYAGAAAGGPRFQDREG